MVWFQIIMIDIIKGTNTCTCISNCPFLFSEQYETDSESIVSLCFQTFLINFQKCQFCLEQTEVSIELIEGSKGIYFSTEYMKIILLQPLYAEFK